MDNTLIDNDAIQRDLSEHLEAEFGPANNDRYWSILETLRDELGYTDYLGALQRYRLGALNDPRLLLMSSYLVDIRLQSGRIPARSMRSLTLGRGVRP